MISPAGAAKNDINQSIAKIPPLAPEVNPKLRARRISVFWSGLKIADLYTEIKPLPNDELEMRAVINSYGVAKAISKYKSNTVSRMKREGGHYRPLEANISFKMRYGDRRIHLKYNEEGEVVEESNIPPENRNKRKEVSAELKKGSLDPLSAVLEARARLMDVMAGKTKDKQFTLPLYDGRRSSTLRFSVEGLDEEGRIQLTMVEEPGEGWTNNELKEKKKRNPIIHIYVDQKDYLPVAATGQSKVGSSNGVVTAECATLEECM